MNLDFIRIVLVETSHPGNIGSAARAMKTMGLTHLYLVKPKFFPHSKANELAAGADDILNQAIVVDSLNDAIAPCHLVLGTSARSREMALPLLSPNEQANLIKAQSPGEKVAIVFGREHAGLTNDELLACHYHIHIPTNPDYSSLNLAQAVQIIAYELRNVLFNSNDSVKNNHERLATHNETEQFHHHLKCLLTEIEFLKPSNPKKLMQRLRRLFNRIRLEHNEVNILRGMLTQIQYAIDSCRHQRKNDKEFKHEE